MLLREYLKKLDIVAETLILAPSVPDALWPARGRDLGLPFEAKFDIIIRYGTYCCNGRLSGFLGRGGKGVAGCDPEETGRRFHKRQRIPLRRDTH